MLLTREDIIKKMPFLYKGIKVDRCYCNCDYFAMNKYVPDFGTLGHYSASWLRKSLSRHFLLCQTHVSEAFTRLITWAGIKPELPQEVSALISQHTALCSCGRPSLSPCRSSMLILWASRAKRAGINWRDERSLTAHPFIQFKSE